MFLHEKDRLCEKNSSILFFVCLQSWDTLTPRTPQNEKVSVPVAAQEEGGQRWSTCPIFFSWLLDHVTYLKLRKKYQFCKAGDNFLGQISRSPHTNNQYESQNFAINFCLLALLVNIGNIKVLN